MSRLKVVILGLVWPEPSSSAAGSRMIQLIQAFINQGFEVVFASAASRSPFSYNLKALAVREEEILLNDSSFDSFILTENPDIVLFDRFMLEEQYGWRVTEHCPQALKVLDTEDLHFLRQARQQEYKKQQALDLYSDTAKREIASIMRSDLSLMISKAEIELLVQQFKVDPSLLYYLPFLEQKIDDADREKWIPFGQRKDFVFIGNFLHEPNWNAVQRLKSEVWPSLRKIIPTANLHIYGAYASQKVTQLHNPKERFYIQGRAEDARETLANYRVLLAPLAFGAGVKGKFVDAMHVGTASVTTSIGAEGMIGNLLWNGLIADDMDDFVAAAAVLYQDEEKFSEAAAQGQTLLNAHYAAEIFIPQFIEHLNFLMHHLSAHRQANFIGQILQHHAAQSTKYMSLWIEAKNKKD